MKDILLNLAYKRCDPRLIFIGSDKDGDLWVDPKGIFMAGVATGSVYEVLGKEGLSTDAFSPVGTASSKSHPSYFP